MFEMRGFNRISLLVCCFCSINYGLSQNQRVYGPPPGAALPQGPTGAPGGPPSMRAAQPPQGQPQQQQWQYRPPANRPGPMAPSQMPQFQAPQNNFQKQFRSFGGFSAQLPASMQPQKPKPQPRPLGAYAQFTPQARRTPVIPQLQAPVGAPQNAPTGPDSYSAVLSNFRANMKNVLKRLRDRQMNMVTSPAANMINPTRPAPSQNSMYKNKPWNQPPKQQTSWQQPKQQSWQPPQQQPSWQQPPQQSWQPPQQSNPPPQQPSQPTWQQPQQPNLPPQQPPQPTWQPPQRSNPPPQQFNQMLQNRFQQPPQQMLQQQPPPSRTSTNNIMQMLLNFQKMRNANTQPPQSPAQNKWNTPYQPPQQQNIPFSNLLPNQMQPPQQQQNFFQNRPQQQFQPPMFQNQPPQPNFNQPLQQQSNALMGTQWNSIPQNIQAPWQRQPQQPPKVYFGKSDIWVRQHKPAPKYGLEPTSWNNNNQPSGQRTLGVPPPTMMGISWTQPSIQQKMGNPFGAVAAAQAPTMGNPFGAAQATAAFAANASAPATAAGETGAGGSAPQEGGMGGMGNPFSGAAPSGPSSVNGKKGVMTAQGWLPHPFNEGKPSECPPEVTPGRLCCDGFWNMVPPPPDKGHYLCCDRGLYDIKTQICVNGMPLPRPPNTGLKMACGFGVMYDPLTALCCDDFVTPNPNNTMVCCRKHPYNPKTHACCGESAKPKPTDPAMANHTCCGKHFFDPATHMCCGDNTFPIQPNMQCCGKRFIIKGQGSCCWGEPIPMGGMCMR